MILRCHSDALYLSESQAHRCTSSFYYMGVLDINNTTIKSAILASRTIMKPILSSASEAEIGALFHNCKQATILHTTLQEMGYLQPATPMQTDNSTACGIANSNIKQQRLWAIDMRFYWVHNWQQQCHSTFSGHQAPTILPTFYKTFSSQTPSGHAPYLCPLQGSSYSYTSHC
jgi:hypothetical protein